MQHSSQTLYLQWSLGQHTYMGLNTYHRHLKVYLRYLIPYLYYQCGTTMLVINKRPLRYPEPFTPALCAAQKPPDQNILQKTRCLDAHTVQPRISLHGARKHVKTRPLWALYFSGFGPLFYILWATEGSQCQKNAYFGAYSVEIMPTLAVSAQDIDHVHFGGDPSRICKTWLAPLH